MEVQDKVIIITGASSGIGLATARLLAEKGASVALVARSAEKLQSLAQELPRSLPLPVDLADPFAVPALVQQVVHHYGRVDGLVNNAGRGYDAAIPSIDLSTFEALWRLNVASPLAAMQAVIPYLEQGGGAIVNISSGTSLMAIPNIGAYSSTKRALNGLSLTARAELASRSITVSLVYPGITNTDFPRNKMKPPAIGPARSAKIGVNYAAGDAPESVAGIIYQALTEGGAEYFAHPEMRH